MYFWGPALRLSERACLSYNLINPVFVFNSEYNSTGKNKKVVLLKWGLILVLYLYIFFIERNGIFCDFLHPKASTQCEGRESQWDRTDWGLHTALGQDNSFWKLLSCLGKLWHLIKGALFKEKDLWLKFVYSIPRIQ